MIQIKRQNRFSFKRALQISLFFILCSVWLFGARVAAQDTVESLWIPAPYRKAVNAIKKGNTPSPLQEKLLRDGLGMLIPDPQTDQEALYMIEAEAIENERGLWSDPKYAVKSATDTTIPYNIMQVVQGTIIDASLQKEWLYLNFGENWRNDFTIGIPKSELSSFKKLGLDPTAWKNMRVQARGWISKRNGAFMTVTHPAQIKLLQNED